MNNSTPLKEQALELIVKLRRETEIQNSWTALRSLMTTHTSALFGQMDTRQLVSLCDTIADYGNEVEKRNAMILSVFVNMEKLAQSYLLWRLGYDSAAFEPPSRESARKLALWDGMDTFHVEIGDVTNNMFGRLRRLLQETPEIALICEELLHRMRQHPTILSALNQTHGHVFDSDTTWRADGKYDKYRQSGEIPPWKQDA